MAARQNSSGNTGFAAWEDRARQPCCTGVGRGTAATRNHSRRYGLVRPRSYLDVRLDIHLGVRQAWRMSSVPHIPVLGREAVDYLAPREGGLYVDATFGAGGYSRAILDV